MTSATELPAPQTDLQRDPSNNGSQGANLHGIHRIFPSPEVLQHEGGKDSISEKKLEKGDAWWKPSKVLRGTQTTVQTTGGDQNAKYPAYSQTDILTSNCPSRITRLGYGRDPR
jgi:hypothetical protein